MGREGRAGVTRELAGDLRAGGVSTVLTAVMVSWVYAYVQTCQIVHFKYG